MKPPIFYRRRLQIAAPWAFGDCQSWERYFQRSVSVWRVAILFNLALERALALDWWRDELPLLLRLKPESTSKCKSTIND